MLFPAAGVYPLEMDYTECCGYEFYLTLGSSGRDPLGSSTQAPPSGGAIPWHPHQETRFAAGLSARVDLADGHVDVSAAALSIPARGPDLSVGHVWDSLLAQNGATTSAGTGWTGDLSQSIGGALTATVVYTDASGAVWPYYYEGLSTATGPYTAYQTPAGQPWALTTAATTTADAPSTP